MKKIEKQILSLDERIKELENSSSKSEREEKEINKKGKFMEEYSYLITYVISASAVLISLITGYYTIYYSNQEYKYKIKPKALITGNFKKDIKDIDLFDSIDINILEYNNLDEIIYIDSKNKVVNVTKEENLKKQIDKSFKVNKKKNIPLIQKDIETEKEIYKYKFVILKGIDESITIELIGARIDKEKNLLNLFSFSEEEMLEFEHTENKEMRKILKQYKYIVNWIEEYTI